MRLVFKFLSSFLLLTDLLTPHSIPNINIRGRITGLLYEVPISTKIKSLTRLLTVEVLATLQIGWIHSGRRPRSRMAMTTELYLPLNISIRKVHQTHYCMAI